MEQAAISAIMYVTNTDPVRVAFTEGFGEADSSSLSSLLSKNGYDIETINLQQVAEVDGDIDYIVMYAPSMDYDNDSLTKLSAFLDNGGAFGKNLIYFASYSQPDYAPENPEDSSMKNLGPEHSGSVHCGTDSPSVSASLLPTSLWCLMRYSDLRCGYADSARMICNQRISG